jgi:hypothetical protein
MCPSSWAQSTTKGNWSLKNSRCKLPASKLTRKSDISRTCHPTWWPYKGMTPTWTLCAWKRSSCRWLECSEDTPRFVCLGCLRWSLLSWMPQSKCGPPCRQCSNCRYHRRGVSRRAELPVLTNCATFWLSVWIEVHNSATIPMTRSIRNSWPNSDCTCCWAPKRL